MHLEILTGLFFFLFMRHLFWLPEAFPKCPCWVLYFSDVFCKSLDVLDFKKVQPEFKCFSGKMCQTEA